MPSNLTQLPHINAIIGLYITPSRYLSPTQNRDLQQFPTTNIKELCKISTFKNKDLQSGSSCQKKEARLPHTQPGLSLPKK